MRVDAYNSVNQVYQTKAASKVEKAEKTRTFSDEFKISQTAQSYQAAKAAVADTPDVRADKVAEIKAQMEAGTYNISSESVADKILGNVTTLKF